MKFEQLLQLVDAVSESALTELKYEEDGVKIALKKTNGEVKVQQILPKTEIFPGNAAVETVPVQESQSSAVLQSEGKTVKSPLVGTFYAAPSEEAEPFVKVGDRVEEGQVLAIVEAMKLMNEIESEFSGTITEVLVENGESVEYGQPLFVIK